jgi:hypothetical protein
MLSLDALILYLHGGEMGDPLDMLKARRPTYSSALFCAMCYVHRSTAVREAVAKAHPIPRLGTGGEDYIWCIQRIDIYTYTIDDLIYKYTTR